MKVARAAFETSQVVQYVNFWPCEWENDHDYMSRLFEFAEANDIGLGGPDIVPWRRGQMKNSYPFFNQYKGRLGFVGMAVQEPTLDYVNEETGKPFTKDEFVEFATDYLGWMRCSGARRRRGWPNKSCSRYPTLAGRVKCGVGEPGYRGSRPHQSVAGR